MAFIPAPAGIAAVRVTFNQGGMIGQNVFHFRSDAGATLNVANLTDIVQQFSHAFNAAAPVGPLTPLANEVVLTRIEAISLEAQDSPGVSQDFNLPGKNNAATPCPPGVALVITHNTGLRGRWNRGRTYFMGVGLADVDTAGGLVPAALATWQDAWTGFRTNVIDAAVIAGDLVVLSYRENNAPRGIATYSFVTSLTVKPHVGSQRRRNVN